MACSKVLVSKSEGSLSVSSLRFLLLTGCLFVTTSLAPAFATAPALSIPSGDNETSLQPPKDNDGDEDDGPHALGFLSGLQRSSAALGNMWGVRPWLSQYGLSFGLQETSEVLGNVSGGTNRSFDYDGLTQMALQMDTQRAFGLYGGTFNISALNIHGRNLSSDNLQTLQTASGIESDRATRLWELWYDQKFLSEDRLDVKIGQQSLDQEFMGSQNANLFVNTMFGWPMLPSADLPAGGPAYPLSALGVRVRGKPTDSITILGGIFNGSPDPINSDMSQEADAGGTAFALNGGILAIAEIQFAYPALGSMVDAGSSEPLPRVYKIGVWYDTENFADQQFDNTGLSLADPGSTGVPLQHHGDYGIYGVADQMIWKSSEEADRNINFFTRIMGTPQANRNLIDFSLNAGFTMHEPFIHRDDDTVGIALGYAHVSNAVAQFEQAVTAAGTYTPTQTSETFVEATYSYQLAPWWTVQPDFQYTFNPGGSVLDPNTGTRVKNEAVMGVRTIINF